MESTITNGQTCLEKVGIDERKMQTARNDYRGVDESSMYGPTHKDAISDGDPQGKGTGGGGHTHWLPNCNGDKNRINYSNFSTSPTEKIGGEYDIKGRNGIGGRERAMASSLYNYENQYGPNLIDTSASQADGQYVVK